MAWFARNACLLCLLLLLASGCHMAQVSVTNPIPEMTTIAVAPFFNLSGERTVDGRRFAEAYFSELQKTPGFQVIPIGVAERAIQQESLEMSNPGDALRLAEILGADAVVVGAVTDYDPYYPPRIGLQVSWYSPFYWTFPAGIECENCLVRSERPSRSIREPLAAARPPGANQRPAHECLIIRAQSASNDRAARERTPNQTAPPSRAAVPKLASQPVSATLAASPVPFDPLKPLMSYTRMFDGADAALVANLRDYVELSGDERSGGWEAYLHRSEDFIRFTSHLMIVEMLTLHGGEAKRRFVFALRNQR